jgi:MFS family permease
MGILINKRKGVIFTGIGRLAIVGLIAAFSFALIETVWAVYMDSFLNSISLVGFFSAALTLISLVSYFLFIPLIEKTGKSKIYLTTLLLFTISYILFAINTKFYFFVILAFIVTILQTLRITSFGIIVRDKSYEKNLSRNEGLMYTFMNIAWVIGPLISGFLAAKYNVNMVFVLSAIFIFLAFLLFKVFKIRDTNIKKKIDTNVIKNFSAFFKSKDRMLAYILGGGVNLWWILIYLFMPLYIIRQGLSTMWVGIFLFAAAIPLISLQYRFSKLAGKTGFKKLFKIGFSIPAIAALVCFFIPNIYVMMVILVIASIGLAMTESTTEAYFFDLLKKDEECRFYGPYNTTIEVNHFIGRFLPSIILLFLPFKFVFLVFAVFMIIMVLLSSKARNIIEFRRDGKVNK